MAGGGGLGRKDYKGVIVWGGGGGRVGGSISEGQSGISSTGDVGLEYSESYVMGNL